MLESFIKFIIEKDLFKKEDKILLAVSGGVDSIVMCNLFYKAGFSFAIAHCNFQLRGKESDEDERFIKEIAFKYNAQVYSEKFNTSKYSEENKLSIQVAARNLRYNWFKELIAKNKFNYLATAHHQNDVVETFLINLIRGTGISGLSGITEKRDYIIRPLLFTKKDEILEYAKEADLKYREDSSNLCDKYTRNKIRHHIVPLLKGLNSNALLNIINTIQNLKDVESVFLNKINEVKKKVLVNDKEQIKISIVELKKLKPTSLFLFELLQEFGFNSSTVKNIVNNLDAESGKVFYSQNHKLVKDRNCLIITNCEFGITNEDILIASGVIEIKEPFHLQFKIIEKVNFTIPVSNKIASLDFDKLKFPLILRKWRQGDKFFPLGMKGRKKVSDFLIDKKMSLADKENIWVLCSGNDIVWILGHRIDERYRVVVNTINVYEIEIK